MIIRIVKMTFVAEQVPQFIEFFNERKHLIRHFDGCQHLELWQEAGNPAVIFTYSIWNSEEALNRYRFSDLFKDTWKTTKAMFAARAEAWSINALQTVE